MDSTNLLDKIGKAVTVFLPSGREINGTLQSVEGNEIVMVDGGRFDCSLIMGITPLDGNPLPTQALTHAAQITRTEFQGELENIISDMITAAGEKFELDSFIREHRGLEPTKTGRAAEQILNKYQSAVKAHEDTRNSYKMENMIRMAREHLTEAPGSALAAGALGFALFRNGDVAESYDVLNRAGLYLPAAQCAPDDSKRVAAATSAVMEGDRSLAAFGMLMGEPMKQLAPLLSSAIENTDQGGDVSAFRIVAAIAWRSGGFSAWADEKRLDADDNRVALKRWLDAIAPDSGLVDRARSRANADQGDRPNASDLSDSFGILEGRIYFFSNKLNGHFYQGTIVSPDLPRRKVPPYNPMHPDRIQFNLNQVADTGLRRRLMSGDEASYRDLTVEFTIGKTNKGKAVANRIQVKGGLQLTVAIDGSMIRGTIEYYHRFNEYGRIESGGKVYNFAKDDVIDEILRASIDNYDIPSDGIPVMFERIKTEKGELRAASISPCKEMNVASLERDGLMPDASMESAKLSEFTEEQERAIAKSFFPLPELKPSELSARAPSFESLRPSALPAPVNTTKPSRAPSIPAPSLPMTVLSVDSSGRSAFQRGHMHWLARNDQAAERAFLDAIREGDRIVAAVNNLISIYCRTREFEKGTKLLKDYSFAMDEEKSVHAEITLLSASKNDNPRLVTLYGRACDLASDPSTKLHMMMEKARIEFTMERYSEADETCNRLINESLRLSRSYYEAPRNLEHMMRSAQKLKAQALYLSGKKAEAKELAETLRHVYPYDIKLQEICQGRLERSSSVQEQLNEVSAFERMPEFVQSKLREISIDSMINTKDSVIADSGYKKGNLEKAEREYGMLPNKAKALSKQSKAPWFFAAAKYIYIFLLWADKEEIDSAKQLQERHMVSMAIKGIEQLLYDKLDFNDYSCARYFCTILFELGATRDFSNRAPDNDEWLQMYILSYFQKGLMKKPDGTWSAERLTFIVPAKLNAEFNEFFDGLIALYDIAGIAGGSIVNKVIENCWYNPEIGSHLRNRLSVTDDRLADSDVQRRVQMALGTARIGRAEKVRGTANDMRIIDPSDLQRADFITRRENAISKADIYGLDEFRRNTIFKIFDKLRDVPNSFNSAVDKLSIVKDLASSLIKEILDAPTEFSYRYFIPMMHRIIEFADNETTKLYSMLPDLAVDFVDLPRRSGNMIYVTMNIRNAAFHQPPHDISLQITSLTDGIKPVESVITLPISGDRDQARECVLTFEEAPEASSQSLDIRLDIDYSYYKNSLVDTTLIQDKKTLKLDTLPLNDVSEFKSISNPFKNYSDQAIVEDPKMVFGRDSEITEIIDSLCDDRGRLRKGRSIALWGQKRSGKSTLLYHVRRRIIERFSKDVIIIDLGSVGSYDYRGGSFRRNLMLGIISKLSLPIRRKSEEFREICGEIPSIEVMTGTSYDYVFNNFMERFTEAQETLCPESRLVIFLDEFTYLYTYIRNGNVDETFLEFWKAFSERFGCISIIVGQDSMPQLKALPQCTNALGTTSLHRVKYLARDAVEEFVQRPLRDERCEIRPDAVSRLYELTAGSAYLLMNLCDCMVGYINERKIFTVSEHTINSIADDVIETGRINKTHFHPQFNDSLSHFGENGEMDNGDHTSRDDRNLELLSVIAEHQMHGREVSIDIIRKDLSDWSEPMLKNFLDALVSRDVLAHRDNKYRIIVDLFKEWLCHRYQR